MLWGCRCPVEERVDGSLAVVDRDAFVHRPRPRSKSPPIRATPIKVVRMVPRHL